MKGKASTSNTPGKIPAAVAQVVRTSQHGAVAYQKVCDERKRPIRGLWVRNNRYYAQITVEDQHTGRKQVRRVPLAGALTAAQAKQQLEDLLVSRRKGSLPMLKKTPDFNSFADTYLDFYQQAKDAKRASTMETEGYAIARLKAHLGHLRLNQIKRVHIDSFIAKRQAENKSARTVNLEVTIFRNVMKRAIDQKLIAQLPTENLRPLKSKPHKRQLVMREQIDQMLTLCQQPLFYNSRVAQPGESGQKLTNAQEFSDYLRLLCFSGARKTEATRLKWSDVDEKNRQLTIGSDGEVKNRKWRVVDFNPELEKVLTEMKARRAPDSDWLFPSPRRGKNDLPVKEFRESLDLVRQAAGLPKFGFHDCRHFFISMCVMSGIDYMTIARWVGHQDGGILIGKVYGHLSNEHAKRQATRIDFGGTKPEKNPTPALAKKKKIVKSAAAHSPNQSQPE